MKLRLHGTPAECAAATERLRRTPGLHVRTRAAPTRTAAASWSASTSPSTSNPPATTSPATVAATREAAPRGAEPIRRRNVIYVEHHDGPEQTDVGWIDWRPGWYAICDDCGWMAGPCRSEADAHGAADAHDLAMGEVTLEELERQQRPAQRLAVAWQVSHGRRPDG
jgi:hypothetical protein